MTSTIGTLFVLTTILYTLTLASVPEPCPHGCRCTAVPDMHSHHHWHRLLAVYRMRRLVYGYRKQGGADMRLAGVHRSNDLPTGREMTCLGLNDMPASVPPDVSKLILYGDNRGSRYGQQDAPGGALQFAPHVPGRKGYQQLTAIRKYTFRKASSVTEFVIEGNRVKVIHASDFDMLQNLEKLRLRNNRLKVLWPKSFAGLDKLKELDISQNHLKRLPKTIFWDVPKLKKISLNKNRIRGLNKKLFREQKHLEVLDLSDNFLRDMPKDVFVNTHNLRELVIDNNNIKYIRPEWFSSTDKLVKLCMKGNRITQVSHSIFKAPSSIKYLHLDKNEIESIEFGAFNGARHLEKLTLSKNNITFLGDKSFIHVRKLKELELSSNKIDALTNETFSGLKALDYLGLSRNNIHDIKPEHVKPLERLARLDLSHNHIKIITTRNFYGLLELKELKLDHNDIKLVEHEGFAVSMVNTFSKITWLYLQYNKISSIGSDMLYGLSYLKFLNMCHNKIDNIDEGGLSMLGRLHTFVMNNNQLPNLDVGVFKHLKYLQHLNLASNELKGLPFNTLLGLERLEDINLQDNRIDEISSETFFDTPKLVSVNLKRNKLKHTDLKLLETVTRLKYLDLSRNGISKVKMPNIHQGNLFFLSLADNNLRLLSNEVTKTMSAGSSLHLYGNPWSCDCNLAWISDVKYKNKVRLPDAEDIVCKTPRELSGEQVISLNHDQFECSANEEPEVVEPEGDDSDSTCSFLKHAEDESSRKHVKARKGDLLNWHATFMNSSSDVMCGGIQMSRNWFLTPSSCWKEHMPINMTLVIGENYEKVLTVELETVVHYPGRFDISLVKVMDKEDLVNKRVFPCLLSEEGWAHMIKRKLNGILDTATSSGRTNNRFKVRRIPVKVFTDNSCPENSVCYKSRHAKLTAKSIRTENAVFFVKVGRTKWSVAGVSGALLAEGEGEVSPIFPAVRWIQDTMVVTED